MTKKFTLEKYYQHVGKIVLVRTHNDDIYPAVVMEDWGNNKFDLVVFDDHHDQHGYSKTRYLTKVRKDMGEERIQDTTWMPRMGEEHLFRTFV